MVRVLSSTARLVVSYTMIYLEQKMHRTAISIEVRNFLIRFIVAYEHIFVWIFNILASSIAEKTFIDKMRIWSTKKCTVTFFNTTESMP